jgi:hypothetical protein
MTPDERNLLNDLANKFAQTPAPPRDPEAEEFIRTHIGNRPDALYMMTQTVLVQNIALQRAQQEIQELQKRNASQPAAGGGSFLGSAVPQSSPRPQYSAPPPPQYSAPAPQYTAPASSGGGGGSSFLRGAAQTAAGVAAGTLAVDAIGSLFHGFGGGGLGGGGGFFGGGERPAEEVVNNYYETPPDDYQANAGNDYADQNVDNQQFDDQQYDDASDMGGGVDDGSGGDFNV